MTFQSINPATGELLETFDGTAPAALENVLARADVAWGDWRRQTIGPGELIHQTSSRLEAP